MLGFSFFEGGDFAERGKAIIQGYCPEHFIVTDNDDRKKKTEKARQNKEDKLTAAFVFLL